MKWKTLCLSAALTAALTAVPAYALDYTVDAPRRITSSAGRPA